MKNGRFVAALPFVLLVFILILGIVSPSVTASAPIQPSRRVFIIDAGHGGVDGGATSCTGVLESAINLEIALRLNKLMQLLGYETVMIRTTDTSVYTQGNTIAAQKLSDLKERVRIVNDPENGVLISIHQNTFSDSRYHGPQVFYGGDLSISKDLGERLQTAMTTNLVPDSNRKCKKSSGIYLMEHIENPGVLIECGFLSNPREEAMLRDSVYQKKLCCIIASVMGACN